MKSSRKLEQTASARCVLLLNGQALLDARKCSEKSGSCAQTKLAYWYLSSGLIYLKIAVTNQFGGLFCNVALNFVEDECYY